MNKNFYVTARNDKSSRVIKVLFPRTNVDPPACSVSVHCLIVFSNSTNLFSPFDGSELSIEDCYKQQNGMVMVLLFLRQMSKSVNLRD